MRAAPIIIVVEDEADIRNTLVEILQEEGYQVFGIASGKEALLRIPAMKPDLILLDWYLSDIDGAQFLEHLLTSTAPEIPVFVTSAGTSHLKVVLPENCKWVAKPYEIRQLLSDIALVLTPGTV